MGNYVKTWEQTRLNALTADIFGFKALQVGLPEIDGLRNNRMQHRWLSCIDVLFDEAGCIDGDGKPTLVHDLLDFPFESKSLDLIILPHVLEFSPEPHQTLREAARVLIPEGQLIICGFNPLSLWGLRQKFGQLTGMHFLPRHGEFLSLRRMKDWLKLLNLETNRGYCGCYLPPCSSEKAQQRYAFMDKAGDRWWPSFGGVYILQAVKRVRGMTLVGPAWEKQKPKVVNIPVTGKHHHKKNGQG